MTICEAITAQYDGLIEVQSTGLDEGTLFMFSIKMELAAKPAPKLPLNVTFFEEKSLSELVAARTKD